VSVSGFVRGTEAGRTFPVSVKGVTVQAGKVLLLENERAEWELPGGKLLRLPRHQHRSSRCKS
jgi:hypothetical protein